MKVIVSKLLSPMGLDVKQMSGLADFFTGILLVAIPWFYVHEGNVRSLAVVIISGAVLILYSIFTDYKRGLLFQIARKIHEALDLTIGVTMMALLPAKYSMTGLILSIAGIVTIAIQLVL